MDMASKLFTFTLPAAVHTSAQPAIITRTRQNLHQILSANTARCEHQVHYMRAG